MIIHKNDLYRTFKLYDKSINLKIFHILYYVHAVIIMIVSSVAYDESMYSFIGLFSFSLILILSMLGLTYYYQMYKKGKLKFDYSLYHLPENGDRMICTESFYYRAISNKIYSINTKKYIDRYIIEVEKGEELIVESREFYEGKIFISLLYNNKRVILDDYVDNMKYIKSKKLIRLEKLKKMNI
jgi:hypothetical protein